MVSNTIGPSFLDPRFIRTNLTTTMHNSKFGNSTTKGTKCMKIFKELSDHCCPTPKVCGFILQIILLQPYLDKALTITADNGKAFADHETPGISQCRGVSCASLPRMGARFKRKYQRVDQAILYQRQQFWAHHWCGCWSGDAQAESSPTQNTQLPNTPWGVFYWTRPKGNMIPRIALRSWIHVR